MSTSSSPASKSSSKWPWISLVLRVILAGVFLFAGAPKLGQLRMSQLAVHAYQIFPPGIADFVGAVLPIVEVALGVLLLLGLFVRWTAIVSIVLLAVFIAGIASVWARGISIDCGCFGGGGAIKAAKTKYPQEIVRDLGFAVIAALLIWRPDSRVSLDRALWR